MPQQLMVDQARHDGLLTRFTNPVLKRRPDCDLQLSIGWIR